MPAVLQPPSPTTANPPVQCGACGTILGAETLNTSVPVPCPSCQTPLQAQVFPALFRPFEPGLAAEDLDAAVGGTGDAEAACFFHPRKRAAVPCSGCGRFLCALCDVDVNGDGRHLCPECLRAGRAAGRLPELDTGRVFYDRLALMLSVLPLLIWPFTLVTAPAALVIALRSWREPGLGPVRRSRAPLVFAVLFALLQLLGWGIAGYFLLSRYL